MRAAQLRGALVRGHSVRGAFVAGCGPPAAAFVAVVHAEVSRFKLYPVAPSPANAMKAMKAAKAMKAGKAKKAAGATSGKWAKVRSLQSRYAACSERLCGLDARYNGWHIWKQKLGMELHKLRLELGQKKEAPRPAGPQTPRRQDQAHVRAREGAAGKKPRHV